MNVAKRKNKTVERAYNGPVMTGRDPESGVEIAVLNDDRGTPEAIRRSIEHLMEFIEDDVLPFPFRTDQVEVNRRAQKVNRKRDGLDILHANGSISDVELIAAREFQGAYAVCHQTTIPSINIGMPGGGRLDHEGVLQRRIRAQDKIDSWMGLLGGRRAMAGLAVECMVGRGFSLNDMIMHYSHPAHYWRGALRAGLQILEANIIQGSPRKKKA